VSCQLEVLQPTLPSNIRRVLEELPESLDETYERILRGIRKPNARRLLCWLAAAVRPLRVEELADVLAIDTEEEDTEAAVMSACSSLVIIVKDGDSRVVRFSHSSVKQFLTSNRLAEPFRDVSYYHIQLGAAHTILAQKCLVVLLRFDDRVERDNIEGFPLAQYAAQYWAMHARVEDAYSRIKDAVECLFDADKPYFSTWLWIYNADRGHSMSTIGPTKPEAVPLYYAARLGFQDLAEHLIAEHPEHVNAKGGREMTPMHAAASGGHANILRLLRGYGADVLGSRNKYGETPLHGASWSGKLEAGQCLLYFGADINARNEDDWTPLFYAIFYGHAEFARMLLEHGAAIEARSVFGSTALHAAVRGGEVQAVRLLLEHGADVNARDSRGWTPSRWKATQGEEMVELLAKYGVEFGKSRQLRQSIDSEVLPESDREDDRAFRSAQPSPDGSLETREREDSVGLLSPPSSQPSPRASLLGSRNGSATSLTRISGAFRSRSRSRNTSSGSGSGSGGSSRHNSHVSVSSASPALGRARAHSLVHARYSFDGSGEGELRLVVGQELEILDDRDQP
jgi:ankyrin repeat protein